MKEIKFHKPNLTTQEINSVIKVIKSGWLTTGKKVIELENQFKKLYKKKIYCAAINSCTSGLFLSLKALGIKKGDEVITSDLTFTSTVSSIYHTGAKPVIVDIDPETMNLSINDLKRKISKKTRCIIAVHYSGFPVDLVAIKKIINNRRIKIIDDAAHCLPTKLNNKLIGEISSDISVFSFYTTKTITSGEGGMVVSNNKKIVDYIKKLSFHGIDKDVYQRYTSLNKKLVYNVRYPGYKFNLTDINAAIGIEQIKKLYRNYSKRLKISSTYSKFLANLNLIKLPIEDKKNFKSSKHLYVIRIKKNLRNKIMKKLIDNGIGVSLHYVPIHRHSFWKKNLRLKVKDYYNSEKAYKEMLSLPIYPDLKISEVLRICRIIKTYVKY